ncbi:MAG: HAD-IIIC family phosphatase, partial [Deltaproteobacteria bacterium]|nr:HAD-IIIC family phosphatase [Deltaproteobacteria bacterium]
MRKLNLELATHAGPSFALLDVDALAAGFGKERWTDPRYWYLAKEEVTSAARPTLARAQAAMVRGMLGLSKKAIVVDLDNTLWGGVVGEDGVASLELGGTPRGEAFVAFQRHLTQLRARGVLIAIASKNNEADAMRALQEHPEMVLRPTDFAAMQIHWDSKSKSVVAIAQELDIGLDSLVFVDDNPLERAEVRAACPEVEVVAMPEDPSYYVRALD